MVLDIQDDWIGDLPQSKAEIIQAFCKLQTEFTQLFDKTGKNIASKSKTDTLVNQITTVRKLAWKLDIRPMDLHLANLIYRKEKGEKGLETLIFEAQTKLNK
jgi:hypothetical protein